MLYASMAARTVGSLCGVAPMKREHLTTGRQNGLARYFKVSKLRSYASIYRPPSGIIHGPE